MRIMGSNFGNTPAFTHQIHNKRYRVDAHIHQYAELVFVLEGEMRIVTDGVEQMLTKGEAALFFPFQTHRFLSSEVNKIAMYLFSPAAMIDFLHAHEGKVGTGAKFLPSEATRTVFKNHILGIDEPSVYHIKAFLYLALNDYIEQNALRETLSGTGVVARVIEYMNAHFTEQITLTTVAQALGYSANYLSHCITKLYGLNFCTALASLRSEHARKLLTQTEKSITEIAYECGFGSQRSFLRQFKSSTGFTPSTYRTRFFTGYTEGHKTVSW